MITQHIAIATPKDHRAAAGALLAAWRFRLFLVLICAGFGLVSVMLGPDNYWDLRFYHLYAPFGYLHDRYLYDIGPAQEEGFLNPVADFLLYGLISSPLNETPRLVAFVMGAVHGINAAIIFAIACHVIRLPSFVERWTMRAAALLMGTTGAGFISLLGTCSNDLTTSLFVLGSLLGLLKMADPEETAGPWRGFTAAGLSAGIGIGLKYLSAIFIPGLGIVAFIAALRRKTFGGLLVFGIASSVGLLLVAGPHMLTLWNDFRNPFFPYLNQIFQSPYFEPEAIVEDRFIAHDFWQWIAYPFYWTKITTYVVAEPPFRDWRGAIAYIAMIAGILVFVRAALRGNGRSGATPTRDLDLVFVFIAVSYFVWAATVGYYRYAMPLELLTGVATMGALGWLVTDRRLRIIAAVLVLAIAGTTTVYLDWGRRSYGDRYVDVRVPPLPANGIVLLATGAPVSYFIPFAEPRAQYVGIENNYLRLSQSNKLADAVKQVMQTLGRPKFALNVNEFDPGKWNEFLDQFGLRLSGSPCLPIHSNLEVDTLSLCPLAER